MKLDAMYVVVHDMRSALEFYAKLFERKPTLSEDRFSGFDLGGVLFGLFNASYMAPPIDAAGVILGNNCVPNVYVEDVDYHHARIAALRPPLITSVEQVGTYRFFQMQDPDGNRVEFYEVLGDRR